MEKLSGKTALVTGSTDGVGRLVARELGQAGARVLVHGRDAERGARVVADIEASGGAADFLAADLSALAEVRRLADAAQATVDRLDILINNAESAPLVRVRPAPRGLSCGLRSITSPAFCSRCCYCRLSRTAHQRGS
jgi:NAD(P)-dependent dehydrogenase (short-subunit alcohol dehydrogenase family)